MFPVTFYKFTKKENSTLRPSGGESFDCKLVRGSGVQNATIELGVVNKNITSFNYAYIPNFGRYYHITDMRWSDGLWIISLSVDVLATYRGEIGAADLYVLRAANEADGRVVDSRYPTKTNCTFNRVSVDSQWTPTGGFYVIGITNEKPTVGSVAYYAVTSDRMRKIVTALYSDEVFKAGGFSLDDCSLALQKSIMNPVQYIKSCVYIPFPMTGVKLGSGQPVNIPGLDGGFASAVIDILTTSVVNAGTVKAFSYTLDIPKHPQSKYRGNYMNTSPYTNLRLLIPPFGFIDLDTTVTCSAANIRADVKIDLIDGKGVVNLACNGTLLNRLEAQVGIPIMLAQRTRDYIASMQATNNAAAAASNGIFGAIGSAMGGNVFGAINSGIQGATQAANYIGDAVKAAAPSINSFGGGGSFVQIMSECHLYAKFFEAVEDDKEHNGRPLCKVRKPSELKGYMMIQDGDVATSGTRDENAAIRSYLESGFYYE